MLSITCCWQSEILVGLLKHLANQTCIERGTGFITEQKSVLNRIINIMLPEASYSTSNLFSVSVLVCLVVPVTEMSFYFCAYFIVWVHMVTNFPEFSLKTQIKNNNNKTTQKTPQKTQKRNNYQPKETNKKTTKKPTNDTKTTKQKTTTKKNTTEFSYHIRNSRIRAEYPELCLIFQHSFDLPFLNISNYLSLVSTMGLTGLRM